MSRISYFPEGEAINDAINDWWGDEEGHVLAVPIIKIRPLPVGRRGNGHHNRGSVHGNKMIRKATDAQKMTGRKRGTHSRNQSARDVNGQPMKSGPAAKGLPKPDDQWVGTRREFKGKKIIVEVGVTQTKAHLSAKQAVYDALYGAGNYAYFPFR